MKYFKSNVFAISIILSLFYTVLGLNCGCVSNKHMDQYSVKNKSLNSPSDKYNNMQHGDIEQGHIYLDCGKLGLKKIEITGTNNIDIDKENLGRISVRWESLWAPAFSHFIELRTQYDFSTEFISEDIHINLMLPDVLIEEVDFPEDITETKQSWELQIVVQSDGYGDWALCFHGWKYWSEFSQPFF